MSRSREQRAGWTGGRQIGPIGTAARLAGGFAAVAIPVALSGITWWDVGAAVLVLPLTAVLAAAATSAVLRGWPAGSGSGPWIRSAVALIAAVVVEIAATFMTPLDGSVAIWLFIGVSLLVAAVRGDAGCEAVAIPNAIARRSDPTGCVIYAPVDALEARPSSLSAQSP